MSREGRGAWGGGKGAGGPPLDLFVAHGAGSKTGFLELYGERFVIALYVGLRNGRGPSQTTTYFFYRETAVMGISCNCNML